MSLGTRIDRSASIQSQPLPAAAAGDLFQRFAASQVDGFREQFVKPLLIRFGFHGISNKHAAQEFGRDYVFSEYDALGQSRHLLALTEHAERISLPGQAERLLTRVRQCFLASYCLPTAPDEQRSISAVYVFNTGEMADDVAAHIRRSLAKTMSANVHFLGGQRLQWMADHFSRHHDRDARLRLEALLVQLRLNEHIWTELRKGISLENEPPTWDMRGGLLGGLEDFLTRPVLPERIPVAEVAKLWQRAKTIQGVSMRGYLTLAPAAARANDLKLLAAVCQDAIAGSAALRERITQALGDFSPVTI
ncbi:MAG TPA: hypothetical protein VIK18_26175 [Pirellulales bacterium]